MSRELRRLYAMYGPWAVVTGASDGIGREVVASASLHALGRKRVVRPGWLSKLLEASLAFLPRGGRVRIMSRVMRGMTKHQAALSGISPD